MDNIEERAIKIENEIISLNPQPIYWKAIRMAAIKSATEQKAIDDIKYKKLINELINELYTSRAYHLGITGLDSDAERIRKERDGDCALIRHIDSTIKYVREIMEE